MTPLTTLKCQFNFTKNGVTAFLFYSDDMLKMHIFKNAKGSSVVKLITQSVNF